MIKEPFDKIRASASIFEAIAILIQGLVFSCYAFEPFFIERKCTIWENNDDNAIG